MLRSAMRRPLAIRFARESLLIGAAYMAYELVRSIAAGRALDAFENTEIVVRAEQALGIFAELNVQVAVLSYSGLIDFLSLWYFWGHFPLIVAFAVWTMYRHNGHYVWARNAVFAAGGLALVVYVLFPVAPPRLIPGGGFVDTLRGVSPCSTRTRRSSTNSPPCPACIKASRSSSARRSTGSGMAGSGWPRLSCCLA